ncbi:MAG TPA: sugar porter family MFS transporter [Candidatus Hydrogenedentes bacterium]|nr:sugar porter family MFS transporter [Candidatus Hydrogenedentota bacterium]
MPDTREGNPRYAFLLTGVAALGGLLFGYDTGVISGAIGYLSAHFALNADLEGWAAASALVGCMIGAAFAGVLSDGFGRKKLLLVAAVMFTVSGIGTALPRTLTEFVIARMLGGFGIGAASMLCPLYISEIAPASIRGRLVSINQFAIILGFLVVYCVNALVAWLGGGAGGEAWNTAYGWRWMMGSEILPAVVFLALLFWVPESPRWLVKRGQTERALSILARVSGLEAAHKEVADISGTIAQEGGSLALLSKRGVRKVLCIGIVLAVLQQITGINTVLYYAPEIFKSAGFGSAAAIYQTVMVGVVNLSFTVVAILVVDRVGRKPLLITAAAGMGISLFLLGGAFEFHHAQGLWVVVFVLAYVAAFAVAMGPVVWVILSEIFPTSVRGAAMSIATVSLWIACFLVTQLFPRMLEQLHGRVFFVYGVLCVVAVIFTVVFIPETKGKTLEEIERHWAH